MRWIQNILEVQKWYELLCHLTEFGGAGTNDIDVLD